MVPDFLNQNEKLQLYGNYRLLKCRQKMHIFQAYVESLRLMAVLLSFKRLTPSFTSNIEQI